MAFTFVAATFNAFAFAGAGVLMNKLDKGGYADEMKRHNRAMEKLAAARDKWNEERLKELDRIQNLRYQKQESLKDISDTNRDLQNVETKFEETEPQLSTYYKPSREMNGYIEFVKIGMTIPVAYLLAMAVI